MNRRALIVGLPALLAATRVRAAPVPRIAAAADLRFALDAIIAAFRQDTGQAVEPVYGSSGNLARQIGEGAPFELFFSADEALVFDLAAAGHLRDRGVLYAIGRIVIMVPTGSPLRADENLDDLAMALADGRLVRFAIANPEHAPYGRAAEQALKHRGLWAAIQPRLVLGENVAQAAQFVTSGSAQGGIIALSLALAPPLAALGDFALVPESWHQPLRQRQALVHGAGAVAEAFHAYVQQPAARAILERFGFRLPDAEG